MMRTPYILLMALVAFMAMSCERLPLYDEVGGLTLELNINLEVEIEGTQPAPSTMMAAFYDPESHQRMFNEFTGPTGGQVYADPGTYHLLCYNFNSGSTHIRQEHLYDEIEAYTNQVRLDECTSFDTMKRKLREQSRSSRSYLEEPIIYEPEHLYVARVEETVIPVRYEGERKIVIYADASTMLQTWSVEIGDIVHPEWVQKATAYITGQVPSRLVASREPTGEPSTILFDVYEYDSRSGFTDGVFLSKFRTFGRHPSPDNHVYLILDILSTTGGHSMWEWDVSDQMQGDNRRIVVHDKVEVPDPSTGNSGFSPTVHPWEENKYDIDI